MKLLMPAVIVTLSLSCYGQIHRDVRERRQDQRELAQDRRETRDDRRDLMTLQSLLGRFDATRSTNDMRGVVAVENDLLAALMREIAEGRWEVAKDAHEVMRDGAELAFDRRKLAGDYAKGQPLRAADDRRDKRDDRRDLRDDILDHRQEMRSLERAKQIRAELSSLNGRTDPTSLDRTRALLVEMIGWGRWELHQDRKERREDRRELREDRRETREDLRQR